MFSSVFFSFLPPSCPPSLPPSHSPSCPPSFPSIPFVLSLLVCTMHAWCVGEHRSHSAYVEVMILLQVFAPTFHLVWDRISFSTLNAPGWLTHESLGILLFLPLISQYGHTLHVHPLHRCQGSELRSLCLLEKCYTHRTISPAPCFFWNLRQHEPFSKVVPPSMPLHFDKEYSRN